MPAATTENLAMIHCMIQWCIGWDGLHARRPPREGGVQSRTDSNSSRRCTCGTMHSH